MVIDGIEVRRDAYGRYSSNIPAQAAGENKTARNTGSNKQTCELIEQLSPRVEFRPSGTKINQLASLMAEITRT
ncbi:hypothetical protein KCP70_15360 [Salmonella enterica subsp. enterica]|nr:hypothetical protein KCP70_15360 [Salmonella enterica subsp. enterica]